MFEKKNNTRHPANFKLEFQHEIYGKILFYQMRKLRKTIFFSRKIPVGQLEKCARKNYAFLKKSLELCTSDISFNIPADASNEFCKTSLTKKRNFCQEIFPTSCSICFQTKMSFKSICKDKILEYYLKVWFHGC